MKKICEEIYFISYSFAKNKRMRTKSNVIWSILRSNNQRRTNVDWCVTQRNSIETPPAAIILVDTPAWHSPWCRNALERIKCQQTIVISLSLAMNEDERKKSTGGDVSWKTERATLTVEPALEAGSRNFTFTLTLTATRWWQREDTREGWRSADWRATGWGGVGTFENPFVAGWLVG